MLDAKLLSAAISSRSAYDASAPYITDKDLTPPAKFWWPLIAEWYKRDPQAKSIDKSLLTEYGRVQIRSPKQSETLLGFMNDLPAVESADNVATTVLELKRYNVGHDLAAAVVSGDRERVAALLPLYSQLFSATGLAEKTTREVARDWAALDEVVGVGNRIFVAPRKLNNRLSGGALPGHHIILFGRPEIGKSTISINMAAGFLHYGQRVLYIGNEDNINVLKSRVRGRLADMTPAQIQAEPDKANERANAKAGDRLQMVHLHRGTMKDVEREVADYEPTVVILDQIRNVEAKGDGLTQKLERNGIEYRGIISTYGCLGVSITQAYAGDHNRPPKLWLDMDDIESSRTGLPATGDLIVGISATTDMVSRNQRSLSLPKNKLSSEPNAHEGIIVEIDKSRAKVI